jgi:hypothetical protein
VHKRLKKPSPLNGQHAGDVEVLFDRRVFDYMIGELSKDLSVEEGGKYVGYLLQTGDRLLERIGSRARRAIVIVDFLPSGPNAVRTAVELMPDGPYQEALFREIERLDPAIEHVGTWHSHHCNGLLRLSDGDVSGYFKTVNKAAYRPDFLVASLVTRVPRDVEDVGWIDHFLFGRGSDKYHKITDQIRVVDWPSSFGGITGHGPTPPAARPLTDADLTPAEREPKPAVVWFETEDGRGVLAADKRLFDQTFSSVTATRRDGQITLTGQTESRSVAVTYPRDAGDAKVSVMLRVENAVVLRMECAISHRTLAYKAALAALGES